MNKSNKELKTRWLLFKGTWESVPGEKDTIRGGRLQSRLGTYTRKNIIHLAISNNSCSAGFNLLKVKETFGEGHPGSIRSQLQQLKDYRNGEYPYKAVKMFI